MIRLMVAGIDEARIPTKDLKRLHPVEGYLGLRAAMPNRETSYTCAGVSERMLHTMMPRGVWELVLPVYSKARSLPEPLELDTFFYDGNDLVELTAGACMLGGDPAPTRAGGLLAALQDEGRRRHWRDPLAQLEPPRRGLPGRRALHRARESPPRQRHGRVGGGLLGQQEAAAQARPRPAYLRAGRRRAHAQDRQGARALCRGAAPRRARRTASRQAWAAATRTSTASTARTTPSPPRSGWPARRASATSARATP